MKAQRTTLRATNQTRNDDSLFRRSECKYPGSANLSIAESLAAYSLITATQFTTKKRFIQ